MPICMMCSRRGRHDGKAICPAFPKGIPEEIYDRLFDHRYAFPGDGGIRFELEKGREEILARWVKSFGKKGGVA
jgi:hypothetical protein